MKCQRQFSGTIKNISKCRLLKILPNMLSVRDFLLTPAVSLNQENDSISSEVYSFITQHKQSVLFLLPKTKVSSVS